MCQFFSGIITREKTLWSYETDGHEEIIKKYGLNDNTRNPDFVRVELIPKDGDIFNHKLSNWVLQVDQDHQPDWFSEKFAEEEMKKAIRKVFKKCFLIDKQIDKMKDEQFRFAKNVIIDIMENSNVGEMGGSSNVGVMRESSNVGEMGESSNVGEMWDSSNVGEMWDSSNVGVMRGSSIIRKLSKYVEIKEMYDNALMVEFTGDKIVVLTKNKDIKIKYVK